MNEDFPFTYVGGGYYRLKGVPKGVSADTLHGMQVVDYLRKKLIDKLDHDAIMAAVKGEKV